MDPLIDKSLTHFTPLGLDDLNGKAAMLERLDNKYIIPATRLRPALEAFSKYFDVLEIDGKRAFTYATRYYDSVDRSAYYDHHQGRRKRCKVRIRRYVDAGFSYLEVKLKDKRGMTIKKRLKVECGLTKLDQRCMAFIETCHRDLYGEPLGQSLLPVIEMEYERITLVAKEGGERMTIDTALGFQVDDASRDVLPDMFIVETKSARGNGLADKILRGLHLHPTKRCSKYCVGMAALGQVRRHNRFLPALRRLHLREPAWQPKVAKAA
ncbi:polyphosphate polymerase domain-containing protein [Aliiroseovarius sediminis]|uniref:polyphosphate polymerase domain-containing protein n=1 Tax=Aliiroseovarius sediminis TaxID=2925839 RepID=UPI001F58E714|nr:polyphosphate polymerase domain-containing protein [Aliiroseovarius sediminis]MCI2393822.1 polyphosphate polymerase domain-containing protein [Aliiroseovarius sediminis]